MVNQVSYLLRFKVVDRSESLFLRLPALPLGLAVVPALTGGVNPLHAVLISKVLGDVWGFCFGWEEVKFKACTAVSRQGLNSRILMLLSTPGFLFLCSTAPQETSIIQTAGGGKRKISLSERCIVVGRSKRCVLVLETAARQMSWFNTPFERRQGCLFIAWLARAMLECLPFPGGSSSLQSRAGGAGGRLAATWLFLY